MSNETLIALDAGTTGVTALLFDRDLRPLAKAYREFPQGFPQPGWVEHAAPDILAAADADPQRCGAMTVPGTSPA